VVLQDQIKRTAEIAYIILILIIAAALWREAEKLPPAPYDPLGPGSFPIWTSYGLAGLGVAMLVRLAIGRGLGRSNQSMVMGLDGTDAEHPLSPGTAALTLVLSFLYALALSFRSIHFLPATMVYLFAAGMILGPFERKRALIVAIFAIVAAFTLDFMFRTIFQLDLT
jgi:hypothetical protein